MSTETAAQRIRKIGPAASQRWLLAGILGLSPIQQKVVADSDRHRHVGPGPASDYLSTAGRRAVYLHPVLEHPVFSLREEPYGTTHSAPANAIDRGSSE